MKLGYTTEGELKLDLAEQLQHFSVIGAGAKDHKSRLYLAKILGDQIQAGYGCLIIQVEEDSLKQSLQENLEKKNRSADFLELADKDANNLFEILDEAVNKNKVIYVELSQRSPHFRQAFYKTLNQYIDETCYLGNTRRQNRNVFMVLVNQIDRHLDPVWVKMAIWLRKINFMLITAFDSFDCVLECRERTEHWHMINNILDFTHTKIIFNQHDSEINEAATSYLGLPRNLPATGLRGFLNKNTTENLIDQLGRKDCAVLIGNQCMKLRF